jgi:hypothetical protein
MKKGLLIAAVLACSMGMAFAQDSYVTGNNFAVYKTFRFVNFLRSLETTKYLNDAGGHLEIQPRFGEGTGFLPLKNLNVALGLLFLDSFDYTGKYSIDLTVSPKAYYDITKTINAGVSLDFVNLFAEDDVILTVKPVVTWSFSKSSSIILFNELIIGPEILKTIQFECVYSF